MGLGFGSERGEREKKGEKKEKKRENQTLPAHPVANYPLIASNGPNLMDEIQWLKKIDGTIQSLLRNGT
jgi:hypothetical protein